MGICYKEIGDRNTAFSIFKDVISVNSEHSEANYHIGLMLNEDDNDNDVIRYFEKSFKNFNELSLVIIDWKSLKNFKKLEKFLELIKTMNYFRSRSLFL